MFLYLMRHGEAVQGADDSKRPLSEKGRQEAVKVAQFLLQKGAPVDIFYQSPKQRAKETVKSWIARSGDLSGNLLLCSNFRSGKPRPRFVKACRELPKSIPLLRLRLKVPSKIKRQGKGKP